MTGDRAVFKPGTLPSYEIARFPGDLIAPVLSDALSDFVERHGCLPYGIALHATNQAPVMTFLNQLGFEVPVALNGGAWADELWLQTNDCRRHKDD